MVSLDAALDKARARYAAANPRSRAAHEEAVASMPGGNTRTTVFYTPFPLTMASAAGCRPTDLDGHTYVDLLGDYTAGLYGHSNLVIRAAVDAALDGGWNLGAHGEHEARLAAVLCQRFPALDLVRFTNSGTEANRWTGLGSMMTVHFQRDPVTAPRDLRPAPALRELFHLDLLARGFHLARRGMIALSVDVRTPECRAFRAAVSGFLVDHGALLN